MYMYNVQCMYMYIVCLCVSVDNFIYIAHLGHMIKAQRQVNNSLRTINLSAKRQNINPFLSPEERQELELFEQSRNNLISNTRLFLLEQSFPQL